MGTVIIGGGPHPTANIYSVSAIDDSGEIASHLCYEIRDGDEVLARFAKFSHAKAMLPLIRSGE